MVQMEGQNKNSTGGKADEVDEDEDCPFCQYFLSSPCRTQFREWRSCIKNVKEATECMEPFRPLRKCMEIHGMMKEEESKNESSEGKDENKDKLDKGSKESS
eukprot:CAMPEP_0185733598 /NCGR_PEP_ID=MMETSP1171-20130828/20081_1 /TAXON_ID=374046 /ORGANISM="Helicotheca tamensis, Strain CCMP826" /LENGTH=101 /DNA_ID=CAMNT_0028403375 /DNA_START=6 /DNA_END=311 /DNA_ORIENTATION=-